LQPQTLQCTICRERQKPKFIRGFALAPPASDRLLLVIQVPHASDKRSVALLSSIDGFVLSLEGGEDAERARSCGTSTARASGRYRGRSCCRRSGATTRESPRIRSRRTSIDYGKRLSGMPPLRPSCSLKRAATNWCLDRGVMTTSDRRRSTRRRCRQLATGPFVSLQSDAYRRSCPGNSGADLDVADLKHASTSRRMTIPQSSSRLSYSLHKPPGWVRSCSTSGILQNQTSKRASACSDGHQRK
jgi:hypothetical protein